MEKKILSKIASCQDCHYVLDRLLTKLENSIIKEDRFEFVITQLVNIAEHGHLYRDRIMTRIFSNLI